MTKGETAAEAVAPEAGVDAPAEAYEGTAQELPAEAVEPFLPEPVVTDALDGHAVMVVVDEHDVRMLLQQVQTSALRKWIYDMPDGGGGRTQGLTVHAVQDIVQRMNWTGKCRIGVLPETLEVEQITQDAGNGPEPFWVATVFARDEMTGMAMPGTSMEPQRMRLKKSTAERRRRDGAKIPEDNAIFDVFSRTKAINKAYRNALAAFIPEEIEQTVIAMFAKDPSRVQRIRTEAEAKLAELPAPLDDEEARGLIAEAEAVYDEIAELGGGQGKVVFPPGTFAAWKLQAQHSHDRLRDLLAYVRQRRDEIASGFEGNAT